MKTQFKFEPHAHTSESSMCASITARELVELHHELGYDGIAITDHLESYIGSRAKGPGGWDDYIDWYLSGYWSARQRGDELGISVILGMELRFTENDNDYLIYGIDESFLRSNPHLYRMGIKEFYRKFGNDTLIIQAHPFRYKNKTVHQDCIHGVEVLNSNPNHQSYNEKALELCKCNPYLFRVCGSDVHARGHAGLTYILFDCPVNDSNEYRVAIERKHYILGCELEKHRLILCGAERIPG
ncbi:MAG: PHP domain-containing protein [Oscillospiraceae bacterium]|nr:PHP domain-containing protein [Oscillospiraceae bacterium]